MQKGTPHKPASIQKTSDSMKVVWSKRSKKERNEYMARVRAARLDKDMGLDAPGDNG